MIRGNERKELFLDDDDRAWFVSLLALKNRERRFAIYAYCLMDNHVHLVINEGEDLISRIMKGLQVSYVYYFNKKYARIGHLFQDRFKSEVIEDNQYLLTAIRYIHHNPVKAEIVNYPSEYRWSSYNHYLDTADGYLKNLVDVEPIMLMFSRNIEQAVRLFVEFSNQSTEDVFIDYQENHNFDKDIKTESQAGRYVTEFLNKWHIKREELPDGANKTIRNELILELKRRSNLSNRQVADVLGVNRNVVQRLN
jgi:putative transposase